VNKEFWKALLDGLKEERKSKDEKDEVPEKDD